MDLIFLLVKNGYNFIKLETLHKKVVRLLSGNYVFRTAKQMLWRFISPSFTPQWQEPAAQIRRGERCPRKLAWGIGQGRGVQNLYLYTFVLTFNPALLQHEKIMAHLHLAANDGALRCTIGACFTGGRYNCGQWNSRIMLGGKVICTIWMIVPLRGKGRWHIRKKDMKVWFECSLI